MTDRSFVRFGGTAGILLAITAWVAVVEYYALVPAAQRLPIASVNDYLGSLAKDNTGLLLFNGLYALTALWALIGTVALYWYLRAKGEAWMLFATLVGVFASAGTIVSSLADVARLQFIAAAPSATDFAYREPSAINPFGVMTFGLTAIWFLIIAFVMLRSDLPRLLAILGLVAFLDLFGGFVASLLGIGSASLVASIVAGAVGGPIFWLWLGVLLYRRA